MLGLNINAQTKKNKHILVISMTIKGHALYDSCILDRNLFDSATCITLTFDTINSGQKVLHPKNKLFFDLDTLRSSCNFSIAEFTGYYVRPEGHLPIKHMNGCLDKEIYLFKTWKTNNPIWITNIKVRNNLNNELFRFHEIRYYLKN